MKYTVDLSNIGYSGTKNLAFILSNASSNTADIDDITIVEPGSWMTIEAVTKPYQMTGLTPETRYEVQVQAVIDGAATEWSDPLIFTTPNATPADITVDAASQTATVSWSSSANSYELRYGVIPEDAVVNQPAKWLQYDNGVCTSNYTDKSEEVEHTWGVMYPGSQITGNTLTKVAVYENSFNTGDITVTVYAGGDTAPGTQLYTETFATEKKGFHEVTLSKPVTITPGQNLWITLTETAVYPFAFSERDDSNSRWVMNGSSWQKMNIVGSWMIRGYIETADFGDSDVSWTTVTCTGNTYTLTGLTAQTDYVLQVRGIYDGNTTTAWVQQTFTTTASNTIELADGSTTNSELTAAYNGLKATVTLSGRTLYKDGEWNTLCLPFDVVLDGSPLEGATAKTLTSATMTGTTVGLAFGDDVTTLKAGVPYIIKWDNGDDISDPVFTDVTVVSSLPADRTIEKADGHVKFIGYYDAFTIDTPTNDDIYYMTAGNTLKHTGKERTLKACRAYFQFSESAAVSRFVLDFGGGGITTAIDGQTIHDSLLPLPDSEGWYTVDGQRLNSQPTRKGVFIHNGRKVVIK